MKSYASISATYISSHSMNRCYIKDATGQRRLWLLTKEEIKARRARGVNVEVSN